MRYEDDWGPALNRTDDENQRAARKGTPSTRLRLYFERQWYTTLGMRPRLQEVVANVSTPHQAFQKDLKILLVDYSEEAIEQMMDTFFRGIQNERGDVSSEYPLWRQFLSSRKGVKQENKRTKDRKVEEQRG